jgi:hypothetical protein
MVFILCRNIGHAGRIEMPVAADMRRFALCANELPVRCFADEERFSRRFAG